MTALLAMILVAIAGGLFLLMLVQSARGTVDLFSTRNLFLVGFILFQLFSGAFTLTTGQYDRISPTDETRAALIFTLFSAVFLIIFLLVYQWGPVVKTVGARIGTNVISPGPTSMLTLAAVFLGAGLILRLFLIYIPYVGPVSHALGSGLIAAAVGMAAWAAAPRLYNPAVLIPASIIVLVALLTVLHHTFGRRDLVGVVAVAAWGAYHGYWKYSSMPRLFFRVAAIGIAGLLLFSAYSATRDQTRHVRSPGEIVQSLVSANLREGMTDLITGQMAAGNSMWIIDTRPQQFGYDHLHTVRYVIFHPIPRAFWQDKPIGLGRQMVLQGDKRRARSNFTFGPGIIGHIYNDNPWLALVLYPVFFGLFFRLLDQFMLSRPWNPFVVLPVGVAIGEILGMGRGEIGLFLVRAVVYIGITWVAMQACAKGLQACGWTMQVDDAITPDPEEESDLDLPDSYTEQPADGYN